MRKSGRRGAASFERQERFRIAAEKVARELAQVSAVQRVVLFGSVARPLTEAAPRFQRFKRWRIALPHECKDVDLAVWMTDFSNLRAVQKARTRALNALQQECDIGVAHHQVEIFLLEPGTDRFLGFLCRFSRCPNGKRECQDKGCGETRYLKQVDGFTLHPEALNPEGSRRLFQR